MLYSVFKKLQALKINVGSSFTYLYVTLTIAKTIASTMPPGDINNNNLIHTDDTLTQEAVVILILQFENHLNL